MRSPDLGRAERKGCNTRIQISKEAWHRKQIVLLELLLGFFEQTNQPFCVKVHTAKGKDGLQDPTCL